MKVFLVAIFFTQLVQAEVISFKDRPVRGVMGIYAQRQEEEAPPKESLHQGWIHSFEEEQLGQEMDHLSKLKRNAAPQKPN